MGPGASALWRSPVDEGTRSRIERVADLGAANCLTASCSMSYAANRTNLRLQGGWRRDAADTRRKPPCSPYPSVSGPEVGPGPVEKGREECRTLSQEGFSSPVVHDAQDKLDQTGEWGGQRWGEGGPKLRDTTGTGSKHMDQQTAPRCLALESLAALAWPGVLEVKEENGAQVEKQEAGPVLEVSSHASAHAWERRECRRQGGDGTGAMESCPELVEIKTQGRHRERDCAWTRLLMALQIGQSGRIRSPISFPC